MKCVSYDLSSTLGQKIVLYSYTGPGSFKACSVSKFGESNCMYKWISHSLAN